MQLVQNRGGGRRIRRAEIDRKVRPRGGAIADRLPDLPVEIAVEADVDAGNAEGRDGADLDVGPVGGFGVGGYGLDDVRAGDVIEARAAGRPVVGDQGLGVVGCDGVVGGAGPGEVRVVADD